MKRFIVSLDFDGTLVRTDRYPVFDPTPLPGCLETLEWLKEEHGAQFILLTQRDMCRMSGGPYNKTVLEEAIDWCTDHGIELVGVNECPGQYSWSKSRKVYSDIIIDDHCAGIDLDENECVDWIKLRKWLEWKLG